MPSQHEKLAAMRAFEQDEKLMFDVVPAGRDAVQCVYAYPNTYTVGICSLGYQLVWAYLAGRPDVHCARLFTDASEPLPRQVDLLGFSFSWELDYANILAMLEAANIPIRAVDRGPEHPLIFGGGPVLTANPEPYADWFDVVLLGDGEDLLQAFLEAYKAVKSSPSDAQSRPEVLRALSQVPGIYCPSLYVPEYEAPDGRRVGLKRIAEDVPETVKKQTYRGNTLARSTVVSEKMAWENIYMVEVVRSCPEMCRFCLASYVTLPFRTAALTTSLIPSIEEGLKVTDRIGLLGASVTQHPEFEALLEHMCQPQYDHVRMSVASVRTNTVTPKLTSALVRRGTKSLTIAVESGSERMRRIVNKKLEQADIVGAAINAQQGGLEALKLYGMVGVPGETQADVQQTVDMMKDVRKAAPGLRLTLGCSTFVPKAHTPFQWWGVDPEGEKRLQFLAKEMGQIGVDFRPESYKWSTIQALLSRGDRRLGPLLELVREYGDSRGSFRRAFKELRGSLPPMDFYVHEKHPPGEMVLPWAHLEMSLPEKTLVKHAAEAVSYF
ncbi:radical SAM domain protein [Klebsormidium nitens]|uniref:Radical SAM domain protein n=1 Tax=Klebsormidium nitens TaxID=105231 RepID=A0A1Y1I073_KLENI|nr:radical SAM domain protein [Klebsormidium nitens]|eukprot:GAQ84314.1 radical SAM domain protein [Klebsormidium nitens]